MGIYLPLQFMPGTVVRLTINDSVLYGFVAHSTPERSYFRTGIEVVQVLIGGSDLSQLLKATLEEAMPEVELLEAIPQNRSAHMVGTVPPSMTYSVPVIEAAFGEARNATRSATSRG